MCSFSIRFGNCRSLSAVAHVTRYRKLPSTKKAWTKNVNSDFFVENCDACHREREELMRNATTTKLSKIRVEFLHPSSARSFRPSSNLFRTEFDASRDVPNLVSTVSSSNNPQAFRSSPLEQVSFSGRALHCCKKNSFNSICLVLRVDPVRLIIPSAAEESQDMICCIDSFVSSALHPNFNNQFHCCRKLMRSQAPESAATNSASPLLCAIVDFSARRGDRVPRRSSTHVESVSVASPV